MDGRMRNDFHQAKRIPGGATGPLQTGRRRAPPAVLHGDRTSYQLCVSPRAGPGSKAYLLPKQGPTRRGDEVPGVGEGSAGGGVFRQEASSLLPQLYGVSEDEPPYIEGTAEARRSWKDGALGGGAFRVRHPV